MTDARVVRTRAALHRAATRLASERAVSAITVSDLAAEAGINRATFYKHYMSPNEALAAPLRDDLAVVRARDVSGAASLATVIETLLGDTFDHIARFTDVYATAVEQPLDGVVSNVLSEHFTDAVTRFMESHDGAVVAFESDPALTARFIGSGVAGTVEAWLRSGSSDRPSLLRAISSCLPGWAHEERAPAR